MYRINVFAKEYSLLTISGNTNISGIKKEAKNKTTKQNIPLEIKFYFCKYIHKNTCTCPSNTFSQSRNQNFYINIFKIVVLTS